MFGAWCQIVNGSWLKARLGRAAADSESGGELRAAAPGPGPGPQPWALSLEPWAMNHWPSSMHQAERIMWYVLFDMLAKSKIIDWCRLLDWSTRLAGQSNRPLGLESSLTAHRPRNVRCQSYLEANKRQESLAKVDIRWSFLRNPLERFQRLFWQFKVVHWSINKMSFLTLKCKLRLEMWF